MVNQIKLFDSNFEKNSNIRLAPVLPFESHEEYPPFKSSYFDSRRVMKNQIFATVYESFIWGLKTAIDTKRLKKQRNPLARGFGTSFGLDSVQQLDMFYECVKKHSLDPDMVVIQGALTIGDFDDYTEAKSYIVEFEFNPITSIVVVYSKNFTQLIDNNSGLPEPVSFYLTCKKLNKTDIKKLKFDHCLSLTGFV